MGINDSCSTKQTFCETTGQTISDYETLNFNFSKTLSYVDNITWNEIIQRIIDIYNYGNKGTRNPETPLNLIKPNELGLTLSGSREWKDNTPKYNTTDYSSKLKSVFDFIPLTEYNNILTTINKTPLNELNSYIEKDAFLDIKNKINSLTFFDNRCNDCNVACNTTCQNQHQCYCECYTDCYTECYCQDDCYSACNCQDSGSGGCGCTVCLDL